MNIAEFLRAVGPDKIEFQWLTQCVAGSISTNKRGVTKFSIQTKAVNCGDFAFNRGKVGMIVWIDRERFDAAVKQVKSLEIPTSDHYEI